CWQEALTSAFQSVGDAAPKLACILLHDDLLSDAKEFVEKSNTEPRDAVGVCAFLVQAYCVAVSEAKSSFVESRVIEIVARSLPLLHKQPGTLGELMAKVPMRFHTSLLIRALQHDELSMRWLSSEMAACWGSEPTDAFVSMALSSPLMLSAPLFASFLYAVAAGELTGTAAMKHYERIVRLLQKHPQQLQLALVQPRLFTVITGLKPDRIPEVCRDYLQSPPSSDADLSPVLDLLERNINLATPPKWLTKRLLKQLWSQRRTWPSDGTYTPTLDFLYATELVCGGFTVAAVREQHPQFHVELAALPDEAWTIVVRRILRQFAKQRVSQTEYTALLQMLGGISPERVSNTAAWLAEEQMPSLLGGGNLTGLHTLLNASLSASWPQATVRSLRDALTSVLSSAKDSTLKVLRDQSVASRLPVMLAFLEDLPKRGGLLSGVMRRITRK
ncbi:MAG: hypothetical protein ABL962_09120, partial [Fimbriimonadaceae bacterium]